MNPNALGVSYARVPAQMMTPEQAAADRAVRTQRRITSYPYYSTVEIAVAKAGDGPYTYTVPAGTEVRAFSYGKGQLMVNAGMAAVIARAVDTNLVKEGQTISGENVEISGIFIQLKQASVQSEDRYLSGRLLAQVVTHFSVDLSLNGDQNRFHLGPLTMIPGAGGLHGVADCPTNLPDIDSNRSEITFANNGWPTRSNFFRMPEGLVWASTGQADSVLNVIFRAERDIVINSGNVDLPETDRVAAAGVQGYDFPEALTLTLMVGLQGVVVGPRSRSA